MVTIKPEDYLPQLRRIAKEYDFSFEDISIVPDIGKWCEENGLKEDNPFRIGKCVRNVKTEKYLILILAEISPDSAQSVMGAIGFGGFADNVELLKNEKCFLIHLLLHEIAHAMNKDWSEKNCDEWAFKELERLSL